MINKYYYKTAYFSYNIILINKFVIRSNQLHIYMQSDATGQNVILHVKISRKKVQGDETYSKPTFLKIKH